jgi:hypothetical protein
MILRDALQSNEINCDWSCHENHSGRRILGELAPTAFPIDGREEFLLTDAGRPVGRVLPPPTLTDTDSEPLASGEWQQEFDAWQRDVQARADRYPPGYVADDSRDGIYRDRGE